MLNLASRDEPPTTTALAGRQLPPVVLARSVGQLALVDVEVHRHRVARWHLDTVEGSQCVDGELDEFRLIRRRAEVNLRNLLPPIPVGIGDAEGDTQLPLRFWWTCSPE